MTVLLAGFVLWIILEVIFWWFEPYLRPVERAISRTLRRAVNRGTAALLWMAALASYALLPASLDSSWSAVRTLGFLAFMGMTPLALMATLALREHRRHDGIVRRGDLHKSSPPSATPRG